MLEPRLLDVRCCSHTLCMCDLPCSLPLTNTGVSLLPNISGGPNFQSAVSSGLQPGTNYTVFAAVQVSSSGSSSLQAASPTITALIGLLVPDTVPPSFTKALVRATTPRGGSSPGAGAAATAGIFSIQLDVSINEDGRVFYAVYGNPSCIIGGPQA